MLFLELMLGMLCRMEVLLLISLLPLRLWVCIRTRGYLIFRLLRKPLITLRCLWCLLLVMIILLVSPWSSWHLLFSGIPLLRPPPFPPFVLLLPCFHPNRSLLISRSFLFPILRRLPVLMLLSGERLWIVNVRVCRIWELLRRLTFLLGNERLG